MSTHQANEHGSPVRLGAAGHEVQFYASDDALAPIVGSFLAQGLRHGEGAVVIATRAHWSAFRRYLDDVGAPLHEATREGRVVVLDAEQTLSWIMVNGAPSARAFHNIVSATFNMIADRTEPTPLRAYGEMVDLLWAEGHLAGALALERLWNGFLEDRPIPLLCAYRTNHPGVKPTEAAIAAICATHTHASPLPADPGALQTPMFLSS